MGKRRSFQRRQILKKFTVKYVDKNRYGPSTTEIISRDEMLSRYVLLEEVNFNFDPAPGTTNANKQLYHPLPWIESTYGYYYPDGVLGGNDKYHIHSNRSGNNIPYTGEYFLVNGLSLEWADQDNRGGAANGYVLYVDGSQEPGLVASISTSATICSGQTLYCSMWLCNPSRDRGTGSYADPIFRCNIQGRNAGDADWTDVGIYFVGDLTSFNYKVNYGFDKSLETKESYLIVDKEKTHSSKSRTGHYIIFLVNGEEFKKQ